MAHRKRLVGLACDPDIVAFLRYLVGQLRITAESNSAHGLTCKLSNFCQTPVVSKLKLFWCKQIHTEIVRHTQQGFVSKLLESCWILMFLVIEHDTNEKQTCPLASIGGTFALATIIMASMKQSSAGKPSTKSTPCHQHLCQAVCLLTLSMLIRWWCDLDL